MTLPKNALRLGLLPTLILAACGERESPAEEPTQIEAVIMMPTDAFTFDGPSARVRLGARNITVRPAGTDEPNTGHHHLFVNRDIVEEGELIPTGEGIVHLSGGQSEHTLENLTTGSYSVIAVLGDYEHVRLPDAKTDTVQFTVKSPR